MECIKTIVNSNDLAPFFPLPRSFLNRKIEVLITPVEDKEIDSSKIVSDCIQDAYSRYKIANGKDCLYKVPENLIFQLEKIKFEDKPLISIRDDSVKITLFYNSKKYIIDYKDLCPEIVFVSNFHSAQNGKREMDIKEIPVFDLASLFGKNDD